MEKKFFLIILARNPKKWKQNSEERTMENDVGNLKNVYAEIFNFWIWTCAFRHVVHYLTTRTAPIFISANSHPHFSLFCSIFFLSVNLWASSDKFQAWKAFRECRLDYNKRHLITNTTTHFQNQRKNLKLTKEDRELETLYKCHIRWHKEIPSSRSLTRKDTWKRVHFWRPQVVKK